MRLFTILLLSIFLVSCGAMPKHANQTTSTDPTISIAGAPIGALVYVNDEPIGSIVEKGNVFQTESGTHHVVIRGLNGEVLYDQIMYLARNLEKKIDLP